jgi:protein SCO1
MLNALGIRKRPSASVVAEAVCRPLCAVTCAAATGAFFISRTVPLITFCPMDRLQRARHSAVMAADAVSLLQSASAIVLSIGRLDASGCWVVVLRDEYVCGRSAGRIHWCRRWRVIETRQRKSMIVLPLCTLFLVFSLVSCKARTKVEPRRYEITGKVVSVDKGKGQVVLAHQEVVGYMQAMTMGFKVKDQWALDVMRPGDRVNAVLVVETEGAYLEQPVITKASGTEPEPSTSTVHEPRVGDKVPDFELLNQAGKRIKLSQFGGNPVLLTFIYSRCPLPDYCIRMSNNFAEVAKELKASDPKLYSGMRLVSVSIDPAYDRPEVLRKYAKSYAGEVDPKLEHWTFATGTPEQVKKIADYFGLSYEQQSGQIIHSLRTAVIARDGKIAFLYEGNDWKPSDAVRDLKSIQ